MICTNLILNTFRTHEAGVADVYVDSRSRVWLLDINPFAAVTDSLLFDWSEDALAAPLPAQPEEEALPPDVFLRLHLKPKPVLPHVVDQSTPVPPHVEAEPTPIPPNVASGNGEGHPPPTAWHGDLERSPPDTRNSDSEVEDEVARGARVGCTLVGSSGMDFEFRCVPSTSHIVPDPMSRYRGPADLEMGTLMGGAEGSTGLEDLIETCRLAAKND